MRFENILEWYSGKARDTLVSFTLPALLESEQLGYWKKGVSRTVHATLNKQNVAAKFAREAESRLGVERGHPLFRALSAMRHGVYSDAPSFITMEALELLRIRPYTFAVKGDITDAGETIEKWARTNAEIAKLVELLDSRRPKPVHVMKTLSPAVAQNISFRIGLDVSTIQSPPMHGEWVEFTLKGMKLRVYEIVVDWPIGTQHNKSRFHYSAANNEQCQACGHAIKHPFNWVPILAYEHGEKPVPCSLWVGRDCAEKLFGCEIEGDAIFKGR